MQWDVYDIDWLYGKENWQNINMIGMTRNYREINNEVSIQEKYYISDLKLTGEEFARVVAIGLLKIIYI